MADIIYKLRILRWMVANTYADWRFTIWRRDLDGNYCCDGRECCCGGESLRSSWSWYLNDRDAPHG